MGSGSSYVAVDGDGLEWSDGDVECVDVHDEQCWPVGVVGVVG